MVWNSSRDQQFTKSHTIKIKIRGFKDQQKY